MSEKFYLPDCMMGPSEPCEGFKALQAHYDATEKERDEYARALLMLEGAMIECAGQSGDGPLVEALNRTELRRHSAGLLVAEIGGEKDDE